MSVAVRLITEYGALLATLIALGGLGYLAFQVIANPTSNAPPESTNPQSGNRGTNFTGPAEVVECAKCSGELDSKLKCRYCGAQHHRA